MTESTSPVGQSSPVGQPRPPSTPNPASTTRPSPDGVRSSRRLWLNSTIAFVLAASVSVTLHESAHAVAGLALGTPVILGSFSADSVRPLSPGGSAIMAAAGPLFSLVFGLAVIGFARRAGRGLGRLLWTWTGFISVQNFVGYLLITPFGAGDSGEFVADLGLGVGAVIAFCGVGLVGYVLLARGFVRRIVSYVDDATDLRRLGLFAWLAGTVVVVARTAAEAAVRGAPAGQIAIVMAGAASCGVFTPLFTGAWRRLSTGISRQQLHLGQPWAWLVLALLVIIVQITVLAPGIRIG